MGNLAKKIILMLVTGWGVSSPAAVKFPRVCGLKGKVHFEKDEKLQPLKMREVLHDKAILQTGPASQLCLELSDKGRLIVGESSRVTLPYIELETGRIPEFRLNRGRFRLRSEESVERIIVSDLFRERFDTGDIVVSFDPDKALGSMSVLKGEASFRGLENEETIVLNAGDVGAFQGEILEGQLQYDVLLKGKKVARGHLLPKRSLSAQEIAAFNKEFSLLGSKISVVATGTVSTEQTAKLVAKKPKKRDPALICAKPDGKFNQCAFVCENNRPTAKVCQVDKPRVVCVRLRCNANGEWQERFEYSQERAPCEAKTVVKECDY